MATLHWMVLESSRPFIVFNDDGTLTMESVTIDDLEPVHVDDNFGASCAWSSNVDFYFVIEPYGIVLLNQDGDGWLCRKRSAMFFKMFVEAPHLPRKRRKPKAS